MGLDMYIDKCRNPRIVDGKRKYEEREEVCYWRKFWDLLRDGLPFEYRDDECGQDVCLSKADVEHILNYVTHNKDFFNSFDSVPQVCELLDQYDNLKKDGWIVCFNVNW